MYSREHCAQHLRGADTAGPCLCICPIAASLAAESSEAGASCCTGPEAQASTLGRYNTKGSPSGTLRRRALSQDYCIAAVSARSDQRQAQGNVREPKHPESRLLPDGFQPPCLRSSMARACPCLHISCHMQTTMIAGHQSMPHLLLQYQAVSSRNSSTTRDISDLAVTSCKQRTGTITQPDTRSCAVPFPSFRNIPPSSFGSQQGQQPRRRALHSGSHELREAQHSAWAAAQKLQQRPAHCLLPLLTLPGHQ